MSSVTSPTPPRWAERLLQAIVGTDPEGLSIVGDAREELETRGVESLFGPRVWYWGYVLRLAATYGLGGTGALRGLRWDIMTSLRSLARRPWLTGAVLSTLAVGIGTSTLAYTLVDGVLLRPLGYPDPEELVEVSRVDPEWYDGVPTARDAGGVFATPPATFFDWADMTRSYTAFGAYAWAAATITGEQDPERVGGIVGTSGIFTALAVPPAMGRHLVEADDQPGASPVVVLSHALWSRRFAASQDIVGRPITMDGAVHTVVGVMPEDFDFPDADTQYWIGFDDEIHSMASRNGGFLHALGRLTPGVSVEQARREMVDITARLAEEYPVEGDFITLVFGRQDVVVAPARAGLMMLLASALVVLLVGCANITNLLLARVTERRRELAVHAALGAARGRVASLVLGESLTLALVGGVLGVGLAAWTMSTFLDVFLIEIPSGASVSLDGRVVGIALLGSLFVGVMIGVLPLLRAGRLDLNGILRDGGRGATGGKSGARSRALLVISEVALAVLLLTTSGALLQGYLEDAAVDRGFHSANVVSARVSPSGVEVESPEALRAFYDELVSRIEALPAVSTVALATQMPYSGGYSAPPSAVDTRNGIVESSLHSSVVTHEYFETLGIPLVRGRAFSEADDAGTVPVSVVSEAMVRRFWPDEDPLGRRVGIQTGGETEWFEVVGVVGDIRYRFGNSEAVEYYRLFHQSPRTTQAVAAKLRPGAPDPSTAIEQIVHDMDPTIPVSVRSLEERAADDYGQRTSRATSLLLSILAAVSTALAVLGVYSVLAYGVVQRRKEIGIRASLGGSAFEILTSVLKGGLTLCALGVAIGLALALGGSRLLASVTTALPHINLSVVLGVVGAMTVTSVLASLIPAWRAAQVDPMVAFKDD